MGSETHHTEDREELPTPWRPSGGISTAPPPWGGDHSLGDIAGGRHPL